MHRADGKGEGQAPRAVGRGGGMLSPATPERVAQRSAPARRTAEEVPVLLSPTLRAFWASRAA